MNLSVQTHLCASFQATPGVPDIKMSLVHIQADAEDVPTRFPEILFPGCVCFTHIGSLCVALRQTQAAVGHHSGITVVRMAMTLTSSQVKEKREKNGRYTESCAVKMSSIKY